MWICPPLLARLNSYHPNVRWEVTKSGRQKVPFLDLELSIENRAPFYELFRKPLNAYLYVPGSSMHSRNTMIGTIKGEVHRCFRNCLKFRDCMKHIDFFTKKFSARGYPQSEVKQIAVMFLNSIRHQCHRFERFRPPRIQRAFIPIYHSGSTNYKVIHAALKKHSHLVKRIPTVARKQQTPLFIESYARNYIDTRR